MLPTTPIRIPRAFISFALALVGFPAALVAEGKAPASVPERVEARAEMLPTREGVRWFDSNGVQIAYLDRD